MTYARRGHGHPWKVPAPSRVPIPAPAHLFHGALGHRGIKSWERRQHSGDSDIVHVVKSAGGERGGPVIAENIEAVFLRQRREMADHLIPMQLARQAKAQPPLLRDI